MFERIHTIWITLSKNNPLYSIKKISFNLYGSIQGEDVTKAFLTISDENKEDCFSKF